MRMEKVNIMSKVYHYTECGLDNVQIHNMDVLTDDAGDEVYCIPNVLGLHKVIAHCIITTKRGIGPKELRFLRTEMGYTQAELAALIQKDHQTVGRWERGETPIDANAEFVIRIVAGERLGIDRNMSAEELARSCITSADLSVIGIDGTDPQHYQPLAA
jgi:DNA-binding transcriptional regulator YiaG